MLLKFLHEEFLYSALNGYSKIKGLICSSFVIKPIKIFEKLRFILNWLINLYVPRAISRSNPRVFKLCYEVSAARYFSEDF